MSSIFYIMYTYIVIKSADISPYLAEFPISGRFLLI